MIVVDELSALREHRHARLCVLAAAEDEALAAEASTVLGLSPHTPRPAPRRPWAHVVDDEIGLGLMVLDDERTQHSVQVRAREGGVLVIGDERALAVLAPDLHSDTDDAWSVLVELVLIVARRCEEALDEIDDECQELESQAIGYASSPRRRSMGRLRAELFRIGETQVAQKNLLATEEELAQSLGEDHQRLLARAAVAFGANHSMTTRLYAMLGDVLNEQDSVVSERLTLVATIFLPLTLATGFFGMNFQWMIDRLGTMPAFIAFGIVVPGLLTVATLVFIRKLTRSS
jgi:Mg2+ and Co2+ transporter CorA